nr:formyl transferase [Rhizobium halophytocola]
MTAGGPIPSLVVNALSRRFSDVQVAMEAAEPKSVIYRRRARRFGHLQASGQLATMIAARLLRKLAAGRSAEIIATTGLEPTLPAATPVHPLPSINDPACQALVARLQPAVVLLVSTRIMSRQTLSSVSCPVINLHAGINPAYRGQMGAYWSLVRGDAGNFGATLHLVDAGTDTGATLHDVRTKPARGDFISTYPLVVSAAALPAVLQSVEDALAGTLRPATPEGPSGLCFPPPIWTWLWHGLTRGVW